MTFMALLTKELRLRLRSERTMWGLVSYVLLIGLMGWFIYYNAARSNTSLDAVGSTLYVWLIGTQFFLIFCMTPASTSTAINGEKLRQTYDLLICSRLSAFSLLAGKLLAGIINALLLIAAVLPVFSLVFLFGGVSPLQFLETLLVFVVSTLFLGTMGLLFSSLFKNPILSTMLTYFTSLLWIAFPYFVVIFSGVLVRTSVSNAGMELAYLCNPFFALASITTPNTSTPWSIPAWLLYSFLLLALSLLLFLLCVLAVKPGYGRSRRIRSEASAERPAKRKIAS